MGLWNEESVATKTINFSCTHILEQARRYISREGSSAGTLILKDMKDIKVGAQLCTGFLGRDDGETTELSC